MVCATKSEAGPPLDLVRNATMPTTFKAYKTSGGAPYALIASLIDVKLVISSKPGTTAPIILTYSTLVPGQIMIDPLDNGNFTVLFDNSMFASLPASRYYYAIWGYVNGEPFPLSLPGVLAIAESIGP